MQMVLATGGYKLVSTARQRRNPSPSQACITMSAEQLYDLLLLVRDLQGSREITSGIKGACGSQRLQNGKQGAPQLYTIGFRAQPCALEPR